MGNIKTHTFNGKKHKICFVTKIYGVCDIATKKITLVDDDNIEALATVIEEGLHAGKVPDKYFHPPKTLADDIARLIWRLGWRKNDNP